MPITSEGSGANKSSSGYSASREAITPSTVAFKGATPPSTVAFKGATPPSTVAFKGATPPSTVDGRESRSLGPPPMPVEGATANPTTFVNHHTAVGLLIRASEAALRSRGNPIRPVRPIRPREHENAFTGRGRGSGDMQLMSPDLALLRCPSFYTLPGGDEIIRALSPEDVFGTCLGGSGNLRVLPSGEISFSVPDAPVGRMGWRQSLRRNLRDMASLAPHAYDEVEMYGRVRMIGENLRAASAEGRKEKEREGGDEDRAAEEGKKVDE